MPKYALKTIEKHSLIFKAKVIIPLVKDRRQSQKLREGKQKHN